MRITIVTGPFLPVPPAPCGAVERLWKDLAERFSTRGHQVTLLCRSYEGQARNESAHGVKYLRRTRMSRTKYLWLDMVKDMVYSVRMCALLPQADIVVTNSFWLPVLAPLWRPDAGKVVVNVARVPKGQMRLYNRVARLSAVSCAIRDDIIAQHPSSAPRIKVIPNPIDIKVFTPPHGPRAHDGERILLYTGRLHPEKGLHVLIQAFAQLISELPASPGLRLRLIGPGEIGDGGGGPEYLGQLQRLVGDLPVEICPPIYGRVALAQALQEAHFYCYPSLAERGESFGIAPLEAMATGLAPIVSDLACFRDFIQHERTGFIFDHRGDQAPARLCAALRAAVSDPKRTDAMGQEAASVAHGFDYDEIADCYLSDFHSLVKS